jgi:hypothetical protein
MLGNLARGALRRGRWLGVGAGAGALAATAATNPYGIGSGMEGALTRGGIGAAIGGIGLGVLTRRMGGLKLGAALGGTSGAFYGARTYNVYNYGRPVVKANYGYRTNFPGAQY